MPVAGVVVQTRPGQGEQVSRYLNYLHGTSVHEIVDGYQVVTVIEADSLDAVDKLTNETILAMEDVLGVYPVYLNFEDEYVDGGDYTDTV